jgi:hypothetical protein
MDRQGPRVDRAPWEFEHLRDVRKAQVLDEERKQLEFGVCEAKFSQFF